MVATKFASSWMPNAWICDNASDLPALKSGLESEEIDHLRIFSYIVPSVGPDGNWLDVAIARIVGDMIARPTDSANGTTVRYLTRSLSRDNNVEYIDWRYEVLVRTTSNLHPALPYHLII